MFAQNVLVVIYFYHIKREILGHFIGKKVKDIIGAEYVTMNGTKMKTANKVILKCLGKNNVRVSSNTEANLNAIALNVYGKPFNELSKYLQDKILKQTSEE